MHRKPFAGSREGCCRVPAAGPFPGLSVRQRREWPVATSSSSRPAVLWVSEYRAGVAARAEIQKIYGSGCMMKSARARKREKQQIVPLAPIGADVRQRASKDASRKMKLILQVRPLILACGGYCRRFSHGLEHRQSWHARLACKCMHAHHAIWESLTQACAYQCHTHAQQFSVSVRSQRHQISLTR